MRERSAPAIGLAAAMAFVWQAGAATYYVTPSGASLMNGSDWANAYSVAQLQAAADACTSPGDEIRLRYGTYTNNAQLALTSRPGLTLRGGYLGVGGTFTNAATVLTRNPSTTMRVVYGVNSTFTLDRLTVSGGYMSDGAGLYVTNCIATVTNCAILSNLIGGSGARKGGGILAQAGSLTVVDSAVRANGQYTEATYYGVGICAENASVNLLRTTVALHSRLTAMGNSFLYGGGVYLKGGSAWLNGCRFETNNFGSSRTMYGGALHATGVGPFLVTNCVFRGNGVTAYQNGGAFGGAVYVTGCNQAQIVGCSFFANTIVRLAALPMEGADFWLSGAGLVSDCRVSAAYAGNDASESLLVDNAAGNTWLVRHTTLKGGSCGGVRKRGTGTLVLTNCLVNGFSSHGLLAAAGAAVVAQCTLADNGGWGLTNGAASVTVTNSTFWGNLAGGVKSAGGSVAYTCSQESLAGPHNTNANPRFIAGDYLFVNGLLHQSADSPCIDAGSMTAGAAGLATRTTRTDGSGDTGPVDLGYHASSGVPASLSNLVLYVDVATGGDANNGWSAGAPLKTIKTALTRALAGSTINIATGRYSAASGETFPLDLAAPSLALKGTNRAATIVDPAASGRAFAVSGQGRVWIEGLTVRNGRAATGAGLYLPNCRAVVTNCVFSANIGNSTTSKGGGLYAAAGTLTVADTRFQANGFAVNDAYQYGGGICAENGVAVVLKRVTVTGSVQQDNSYLYGAGVYLSGGSALIADCAFHTNAPNSGRTMQGGGLYASGVGPLTLTNCAFRANAMANRVGGGYGGALYVTGCGSVSILGCVFDRNYLSNVAANPLEGGTLWLSGFGLISDCVIEKGALGAPPECVFVNNAAGNTWLVRNTAMKGGLGIGVRKAGAGTLVLTNCVIKGYASHGLLADAGTAVVAQCTLAANAGWGLTNRAAVVQVRDSVAWHNIAGGVRSTNGVVSHTCSQEVLAGTDNLSANPLFIAGSYLAANGLPGQGADSPCIDAGSTTASAAGLATRTTRTDGAPDANMVDLGYHPLTGATLDNLTLYVNAAFGDNGNNGWTPGAALRTITAALGRTIDGGTIHIAAGLYNQALGEVFPLDLAVPNLTLKATNRTATIVDPATSARAITVSGQGSVWIEGLTVRNGRAATGAGLYLPVCRATVTNCIFSGNLCNSSTSKGGGLHAVAGTLTVWETRFLGNGQWGVEGTLYGGAICAESGVAVILRRVSVASHVTLQNNSHLYGAGVYLSGGSALISDCSFTTNMPQQSIGRTWNGGALYATGVSPLTLTNCLFWGNRVYGAGAGLYIVACSPARILNCVFGGNYLMAGNSAVQGGAAWLSGSGLISGCTVAGGVAGAAPEDLYVNNAATNAWAIRQTVLGGGRGMGIGKQGAGNLVLTNCLVHSFTNHGIAVAAGGVDLVNTTLASNGGWGMSNAVGTVTVRNGIAWGNAKGGLTGSATITYTCAQEPHVGDGNRSQDPLFVGAAAKNFRLLQKSPCVEAGPKESWMGGALDLDGNPRVIGRTADMGPYEMTDPPTRGTVVQIR